jgi:ParB family transcriptional regulator, chromosome partitioning protein
MEMITNHHSLTPNNGDLKMNDLFTPSNDGQMELDVNQAKGADEKKLLADNIEMRELPIEQFRVPVWHPRKSPRKTDSLQAYIAKTGSYEPISVIPSDDGIYEPFDGGTRLEALRKEGHGKVLCLVYKNLTAEEAAQKSYLINTEAKSLTPTDKAHHIRDMRVKKKYTYRDLEIKLGYGTAANLSYLESLLDLPDSVQSKIDSGAITMAHGRVLLKFQSQQDQESMAERIVEEDLSVSQTEAYRSKLSAKDNLELPEPAENIPTDNPGLIQRCQVEMPEQPKESMDASISFVELQGVNTSTKGDFLNTIKPIQRILAGTRRKLRSGGTLGLIFRDTYNSGNIAGDSENTRHVGYLFHSILTNHGYWLKDRVMIAVIDNDDVDQHHKDVSNAIHGDYRINKSLLTMDLYQKKGSKNPPSPVLEKKSRPDEADLKSWTEPIWTFNVKECGGIEGVQKEIAKQFISLYSNAGDSILDPFVSNQAVFKAALETDRIPTGYIAADRYNPDDWEELFAGEVEPVDFAKANASALSDDDEAVVDSSAGEPSPQSMTNDIFANASESSIPESA